MIRLAISVEGETEEEFVRTSLANHLREWEIDVTPVIIGRARRTSRGGGNVTIDKLAKEMRTLQSSFQAVTSLVDFYGFRGKGSRTPDDLQEAICTVMGAVDQRFIFPYVQVHEFEGLLFSDVKAFRDEFPGAPIRELQSIRSAFATPEDINDNAQTAPSKRIKMLIPRYRKASDGPMLIDRIGLDGIRAECPRFHAWMKRLEGLAELAIRSSDRVSNA